MKPNTDHRYQAARKVQAVNRDPSRFKTGYSFVPIFSRHHAIAIKAYPVP